MKFMLVFILIFSVWGCSRKKDNAYSPIKLTGSDSTKANDFNFNDQFKLEKYLVNEPTDPSKVQIINFNCVVLIYPTHEQVEEMKKAESEDDFYTIADDANFYQTRAIQLIDSVGIKTAGTQKQFVKFVGSESSWILDIRQKNLPAWNVILFNKEKGPQPTAAVSLTYESIKSYFE